MGARCTNYTLASEVFATVVDRLKGYERFIATCAATGILSSIFRICIPHFDFSETLLYAFEVSSLLLT
jgi:hypothetical protein